MFVKSVVTKETVLEDVEKAVSIVSSVDRNIPFIIQPVSYNSNIEHVESIDIFFDSAKERLSDVRIIPQLHKILGVK